MNIAIIGGGPAGLYAAEIAARGGAAVTLYDAKPSVGRKFLTAGKGGLNLSTAEPHESFAKHYSGPGQPEDFWKELIAAFDTTSFRAWAAELGVKTFVATTGRIYPEELKAAPLLRRWVQRLRELGVKFSMQHRWTGLTPGTPLRLHFQAQQNESHIVEADAVVLALGGGSWPETGSDGEWTAVLGRLGVSTAPLEPANCGWELPWPPSVLEKAEGKPLKNIAVRAGELKVDGELLITRYGLEGGALYQLGPALRAMREPELAVDFKPSFSENQLIVKMRGARSDLLTECRRRWKLNDASFAILETGAPFASVQSLATAVKNRTLKLTGPRPLPEAISSAGGVRWNELDSGLMLKKLPGVFVAGEMIDWEAPTGGYLIHGCFATGALAGRSALRWLTREIQNPCTTQKK